MNVTRGHGALESFLAHQRAELANRLISEDSRSGRILDIGCGSTPYFLMTTRFKEKFGIENIQNYEIEKYRKNGIYILNQDLHSAERLPYSDCYFDIVTMLAVFEHIEPDVIVRSLEEIYRVLKQGGCYILTTPAAWTDGMLRTMAKLGLVSSEEIDEHKDTYNHRKIACLLKKAGFIESNMRFGHFEAYMNLWVKVVK